MHARARVYTCIHTTKFKELEDGGRGGEQKLESSANKGRETQLTNQRSEGGQEERKSESERKNVSHRLYDYEA